MPWWIRGCGSALGDPDFGTPNSSVTISSGPLELGACAPFGRLPVLADRRCLRATAPNFTASRVGGTPASGLFLSAARLLHQMRFGPPLRRDSCRCTEVPKCTKHKPAGHPEIAFPQGKIVRGSDPGGVAPLTDGVGVLINGTVYTLRYRQVTELHVFWGH